MGWGELWAYSGGRDVPRWRSEGGGVVMLCLGEDGEIVACRLPQRHWLGLAREGLSEEVTHRSDRAARR